MSSSCDSLVSSLLICELSGDGAEILDFAEDKEDSSSDLACSLGRWGLLLFMLASGFRGEGTSTINSSGEESRDGVSICRIEADGVLVCGVSRFRRAFAEGVSFGVKAWLRGFLEDLAFCIGELGISHMSSF